MDLQSLDVSVYFCYPYVYPCVLVGKTVSTSALHIFAYLSFSPISQLTASRLTLVLCCINTSHLSVSLLYINFKFFHHPLLHAVLCTPFAITDCISLAPNSS